MTSNPLDVRTLSTQPESSKTTITKPKSMCDHYGPRRGLVQNTLTSAKLQRRQVRLHIPNPFGGCRL